MDIKSLVRAVVPFATTAQAAAAKRRSEAVATDDRDPNGRQEQPEEEKRKLTTEEVDEVIAYLEALPGVKDNLRVRLAEHEGIRVIFVEDHLGKIVRRIPESDMFSILKSKRSNPENSPSSGNLLNKTA